MNKSRNASAGLDGRHVFHRRTGIRSAIRNVGRVVGLSRGQVEQGKVLTAGIPCTLRQQWRLGYTQQEGAPLPQKPGVHDANPPLTQGAPRGQELDQRTPH